MQRLTHLQARFTSAPLPSVSMQTQWEMSDESQPHAHAGEQGKKGWERRERTEWEKEKGKAAREKEEYKIGWWSQTETARESEGHLPPPSGCWVHSLREGFRSQSGHLKRWGFQEHKNKEKCTTSRKKEKEEDKDVGQRSTWGRHEVRVRRGVRRRKSRTARLQMTCPEKHRERDRFTGNENRAPKRTFSAPKLALKTTPHASTGRENLNVLKKSERRGLTLSWSSLFLVIF